MAFDPLSVEMPPRSKFPRSYAAFEMASIAKLIPIDSSCAPFIIPPGGRGVVVLISEAFRVHLTAYEANVHGLGIIYSYISASRGDTVNNALM